MVQRLFRLRRRIENHDWDFDYNRQHPTEEPHQKDPDISDEEYAEKSKKDLFSLQKNKSIAAAKGVF